MPHRTISNDGDLTNLTKLLSALELPITVEWRQGRSRSLDQNSLQWKWAGEASDQRGDMTAAEIQSEWKLRFGVPILRAGNDAFREAYDSRIKAWSYADKLAWMPFLPVSSIMTVPQMREYLDTIQRECAEQGIRLTDPEAT